MCVSMKPQLKSTPQILHPVIKSRVPYGVFMDIGKQWKPQSQVQKINNLWTGYGTTNTLGNCLVALYSSIQHRKANLHYGPTKRGYKENRLCLTWLEIQPKPWHNFAWVAIEHNRSIYNWIARIMCMSILLWDSLLCAPIQCISAIQTITIRGSINH